MKIEQVSTFDQFNGFLEEVKGLRKASFESLLNKFAELNAGVDNPLQAKQVLQKLEVLKPGNAFNKRIADLAGKILDFALVGSDGISVRASLVLLCQKSAFFGGLKRLSGKEVCQMQSRSDFSGETLKVMMDFLSNGSFPSALSEEQLHKLVEAERYYNIPDLKLKIESYVFYANYPQVVRPSLWKEWAAAAKLDIQVVTDEEAFNALPKNMEEILEARCGIFGGEQTREETRMYVYIPPGLTIEDLGKILKTRFPETEAGYDYIWTPILAALKDQQTVEGWREMTKDVIPGSRNQTYATQQAMVQKLCNGDEHYEVPTALEAIACCLARNFKTQERLLGNDPLTYTRCQEQVQEQDEDYQVIVGGFAPAGLHVDDCSNYDYDDIGVAALRRLS